MLKVIQTVFGSALVLGAVTMAFAEEGVWIPASDDFAQVNVACTRVYICTTGEDIMHSADEKIEVTERELVWGVCSAASGPVDSCNECVTNEPKTKCEWKVVPK